MLLGAAGGAYALVSSGHAKNSAQPPAPTVKAKTSQVAAPSPSSTPATPTGAASATVPVTPTPTPSATHSPAGVAVASDLSANPATAGVTQLLNRYFKAINTRNYAEFSALLDAQMRAGNSAASFDSGYATTRDSAERLIALSGSGGDEEATVSFTSHQSAADSVDGSPCTNWTITLYLVPQGSGYVITQPPSSYHSTYQDCP